MNQIRCAEDFEDIRENYREDYTLASDIDFKGRNFKPIEKFDGKLDGNGHKIKNLHIDEKPERGVGIFKFNKGDIRNIIIEDTSIRGNSKVGSLVGYNKGDIRNICLRNIIVVGKRHTGGITGENYGTIKSCSIEFFIDGIYVVGGLVGSNHGEIKESKSFGKISGKVTIGGLIGLNGGKIKESLSEVEVEGDRCVGGLVGKNRNSVRNCRVLCQVEGERRTGKACGLNSSFSEVDKCRINTKYIDENVGFLIGYDFDTKGPVGKIHSKEESDKIEYINSELGYAQIFR